MRIVTILLALVSVATLSACGEQEAPQAQMPLTEIDVAQVVEKPVQAWFTYTTRLEAPQEVSLTPRVSGVVESIEFVEGQQVQKGQLLFRLDARPFEAQVARLKAQIASAQAAFEQASNEERRGKKLRSKKAISAEESESRTTTARQRHAELLALQAQLQAAELDLEFTQITSPITGLISRAEITRGNNVTANQSVLTTIVSNQEMYAYFDVDERTWNKNFSDVSAQSELPALLQLTGSEAFGHMGVIDFIDNAIDEATGTLRVRARFLPSTGALRAGSFARVKVAASDVRESIVVPDRAIGTDLKNRFVLTVNEQNALEYRLVSLGERYGKYRVVTKGLTAQDRIAVNGPAKVGPGMPISPRMVELDLSAERWTLADAGAAQPLVTAQK